jgi:hypothetical protein
MAEPMTGPNTRCPWCSAELSEAGAEQCSSCGAMLVTAPDVTGEIKGVTTLDTEAILRARSEVSRPRSNRILKFITGEVAAETEDVANPASLAPPPDAVRREMLRLQLEAEAADLQAETVALKSDELARRGIHVSELAGPEPQPGADEGEGDDAAAAAGIEVGESAVDAGAGDWPAELTPGDEADAAPGGHPA